MCKYTYCRRKFGTLSARRKADQGHSTYHESCARHIVGSDKGPIITVLLTMYVGLLAVLCRRLDVLPSSHTLVSSRRDAWLRTLLTVTSASRSIGPLNVPTSSSELTGHVYSMKS